LADSSPLRSGVPMMLLDPSSYITGKYSIVVPDAPWTDAQNRHDRLDH